MPSVTETIPNVQPGDRVVHAATWQGTLDTPAAFEPSDADIDEMARWCEWCERNDEIAHDERIDDDATEARARYRL